MWLAIDDALEIVIIALHYISDACKRPVYANYWSLLHLDKWMLIRVITAKVSTARNSNGEIITFTSNSYSAVQC